MLKKEITELFISGGVALIILKKMFLFRRIRVKSFKKRKMLLFSKIISMKKKKKFQKKFVNIIMMNKKLRY